MHFFQSVTDRKDSKVKFIIKIPKSVLKFHIFASGTLILIPAVTIISGEVTMLLT